MDRQESVFASRVESLLKERNWTQGQLAEATGVGQPAVSLLLTRRRAPNGVRSTRSRKPLGYRRRVLARAWWRSSRGWGQTWAIGEFL